MVWLSWYVGGVGYHWWGTLHNCKFLVIKIAHDWQPWIFLPNTHFLLTSGLHCTLRHCQFETYHTHTEDTSSLNYWFDFWMISFDDLVRTGPYAPNYNWILRFKKIPKPWTRTELRSSTYMWFDMIWSTFRSSHIFICILSMECGDLFCRYRLTFAVVSSSTKLLSIYVSFPHRVSDFRESIESFLKASPYDKSDWYWMEFPINVWYYWLFH